MLTKTLLCSHTHIQNAEMKIKMGEEQIYSKRHPNNIKSSEMNDRLIHGIWLRK